MKYFYSSNHICLPPPLGSVRGISYRYLRHISGIRLIRHLYYYILCVRVNIDFDNIILCWTSYLLNRNRTRDDCNNWHYRIECNIVKINLTSNVFRWSCFRPLLDDFLNFYSQSYIMHKSRKKSARSHTVTH